VKKGTISVFRSTEEGRGRWGSRGEIQRMRARLVVLVGWLGGEAKNSKEKLAPPRRRFMTTTPDSSESSGRTHAAL
jgi:hypothetical protein